MSMLARQTILLAIVGAALALIGTLSAAPQVDADPQKSYPLSPEAGPWVIMAACYAGDDAQSLGRQTVLWLRAKKNLPAYLFDKSKQEREKQEREIAEEKRKNPGMPVRHVHIEDQCAVIIGGFKDRDAASEALWKTVKHLPLPEVQAKPNHLPCDVIEVPERGGGVKAYPINPFLNAMVVPNPTAGLDRPTSKADPILTKLNEHEPFSLLKNKSRWTLLVREFSGASALVSEKSKDGGMLDKLPIAAHEPADSMSALDRAARLADLAADWLKKSGYDAYVLHTRECSYVTVGGFDSSDPKVDPRIDEVYRKLASDEHFKLLKIMNPMLALEVPRP